VTKADQPAAQAVRGEPYAVLLLVASAARPNRSSARSVPNHGTAAAAFRKNGRRVLNARPGTRKTASRGWERRR